MNIKDIAKFLNAIKTVGDDNVNIKNLSPINDISEGSIVCVDNNKYIEAALNSKASAIILREDLGKCNYFKRGFSKHYRRF